MNEKRNIQIIADVNSLENGKEIIDDLKALSDKYDVSVKVVRNLNEETINCIAQHLKIFHEQSAHGKSADFGEPCETCKYVKGCDFDWLAKMKPLLERSNVTIRLCYSGRLHK